MARKDRRARKEDLALRALAGFAVNVATPDEMWRRIKPCGLDAPQISIVRALGRDIAVDDVAIEVGPRVVAALQGVR